MAITGIGNNYNNIYESTYTTQNNIETAKESSNEEYLKTLQKQVPYMKLQIGDGLNTNNDGKVNVVDVNPKLLQKMQNDPQVAKKYTQRLKDVESALKWLDNYKKSVGSTVLVRHDYIDENGNLSHFSVSVRKNELNEKLRKEAQENAEERIEKSREKARENAERILEEKISSSKEGAIYLCDTDMQTIIEAAKEDNAGMANINQQVGVGANLDLKA